MGFWRVAAFASVALALAGCSGGEANDTTGAAREDGYLRSVNVEVMSVRPDTFVEFLTVTGEVEANRDVTLAAEESGVIRQLFVEKGARVAAGQPIAKIDDRILRSQMEQARAVADLAEETFQRRKRLWEEDQIGSELAYLEARYQAEQARASLTTLRERLERTVVRAPFSGILDDRQVEVGSMVAPGTAVGRIVDLSRVKVRGGVPERYAGDVDTGRPVQVRIDVLGALVEAEVSYVGATVHEQNRTFLIEVAVPNPGGRIKPEMVASIRLPLREHREAIVVPQEALIRSEEGFVAYVAVEREGQTVAEMRPVSVVASQGNRVVVGGGIEADERLIVRGQNKVAEGDPVTVVATRAEDGR